MPANPSIAIRNAPLPRQYTIEAWLAGQWTPQVDITDNHHRQRRHVLPAAVTTTRLRIVDVATHGDPSTAIYEVRCYAP